MSDNFPKYLGQQFAIVLHPQKTITLVHPQLAPDNAAKLRQYIKENWDRDTLLSELKKRLPNTTTGSLGKMLDRFTCSTSDGNQGMHKYKLKALCDTLALSETQFEDLVETPGFFSQYGPEGAGEEKREFIKFFGAAVDEDKKFVQLVFPQRTLKKSIEKKTESPFETDSECHLESGHKPEGVSGWMAFEDVRAATHVSNVIARMLGKEVWVRQENKRVLDPSICLIIFGLGFTGATRIIERQFNPRLFEIYFGESPKTNVKGSTDHFRIKWNERTKSGDEKDFGLRDIPVADDKDVALLARIVPGKGSQPWFIVAGRTAMGTSVASYFLSNQWETLRDLYVDNKKSPLETSLVAVIEHDLPSPDSAAIAAAAPNSIEKTGKLYNWDGDEKTPCIGWGMYSG